MRKQVLSLLVENNPGVTSHISGLFSRRGYNIDSFSSGVTADPRYTRITIVATGDEQILEQIEKQLAKLEDVVDIKKLENGSSVTRELILVKIRAKDTERQPILNVTEIFDRCCHKPDANLPYPFFCIQITSLVFSRARPRHNCHKKSCQK